MRKILDRNTFINNLNDKRINEVFANETQWGDTLLGRLINSTLRKVDIGQKLVRMELVINELNKQFDDLVDLIQVDTYSDSIFYIKVSALLGEIKVYISENTLKELIRKVKDVITIIEGIDVDDKIKNDKDEVLKKLNEFLEYLESIVEDSDEDSDEENAEGDQEEGTDKNDTNKIFLKYSKELLQSVVDLHKMINQNVVRTTSGGQNNSTFFDFEKFNSFRKKYENSAPNIKLSLLKQLIPMVKKGLDVYKNKNDKEKINIFNSYLDKYSKEYEKLSKGNKPSVNAKSVDDIYKELLAKWIDSQKAQGKNATPDAATIARLRKEAEKISGNANSSFIFEEAEANLRDAEKDAKNAWNKVLNAYNKSNIKSHISEIEELLSVSSKDGIDKVKQSNNNIKTICKQVISNMPTSKPISFEELIKEGKFDNDIPKSISLLSRVLLAFKEDMGLIGAYGSVIKPIKSFINSFNELVKIQTPTKESYLYKYKEFILEKNESNENEVLLKFDEIFTKEFMVKYEITKSPEELEKKIKTKERAITIDPIIEIVKIFNRAYKLHTPGMIPSGRKGNVVSNRVFREYEFVGDGSDNAAAGEDAGTVKPGIGPYRNKSIFNKWENAVFNIIKNPKYQQIFNEKTYFHFAPSDPRYNTAEGSEKKKEGGGKALLTFMNAMLDDSRLYREGAQSKFISEYFDVKVDPKRLGYTGDKKKVEEAAANAKPEDDKNPEFKKYKSSDFKNVDDLKECIFEMTNKDDKTWYLKFITNEGVFIASPGYPFDLKCTGMTGKDLPKDGSIYIGKISNISNFGYGELEKTYKIEKTKEPKDLENTGKMTFKQETIKVLMDSDKPCKKDSEFKEDFKTSASYINKNKSDILSRLK
jgi:hypothetical protein